MSVPARRRIIAARDPDVLRAELNEVRDPDDPKDPVRFALRALLDNGTVDLEGRTVEELRAIENAATGWVAARRRSMSRAFAIAPPRLRPGNSALPKLRAFPGSS